MCRHAPRRRRGKRRQKHYTVFVASIAPEARAAFKPQLNEEHVDWRWAPLAQLSSGGGGGGGSELELHPVIRRLLEQHPHALQAAAAAP